jgi:hypothetical protein
LVGLIVGLVAGGRVDAFLSVRLRFLALLVAALVLRFGTAWLIESDVEAADALRLPLYATAFTLVALVLWLNRTQPGLLLVMVGVMANGLAVVVNAGWMPYYPPALEAAGLTVADLSPAGFFTALPMDIGAGFLLQAGPFGDVVPLPLPYLRNVISLGDIAISIGLGWFVLATMLRGETAPQQGGFSLWAPSCSAGVGDRVSWHPSRWSARTASRSRPSCPRLAGSIDSVIIPIFGCCGMPASPRSGWARPSACSVTGCISSRWARSCWPPRARTSRSAWCS